MTLIPDALFTGWGTGTSNGSQPVTFPGAPPESAVPLPTHPLTVEMMPMIAATIKQSAAEQAYQERFGVLSKTRAKDENSA